ncbi:MAG: VOC family protein [Chloroflexi bacterium]|nr:VOC family protein [Chloroflexota bacterium]
MALAQAPAIAFVPTTRPDAARAFYRDVLGLRLTDVDEYAAVFDLNGTMLRLVTVNELQPAGYTLLGWIVDDIVAEIDALVRKGVAFERYGWFEQDEHGVWTAPGGAGIAWFKDPDGNTLSLTQFPG